MIYWEHSETGKKCKDTPFKRIPLNPDSNFAFSTKSSPS